MMGTGKVMSIVQCCKEKKLVPVLFTIPDPNVVWEEEVQTIS